MFHDLQIFHSESQGLKGILLEAYDNVDVLKH